MNEEIRDWNLIPNWYVWSCENVWCPRGGSNGNHKP